VRNLFINQPTKCLPYIIWIQFELSLSVMNEKHPAVFSFNLSFK